MQKIVDGSDATDNSQGLAAIVSGRWADVQVGVPGVPVSADTVQSMREDFLADRQRQGVVAREHNRTVYIETSNGDRLILSPDGSGPEHSRPRHCYSANEYARGGGVLAKHAARGNQRLQLEKSSMNTSIGRALRAFSQMISVPGCLLALSISAFAQTAAAPPAPAPLNLAAQEKQWQNCEGGYYTGPRQGRRNYSNDKYLWVVTPGFAKRFCMPEHMVSAELKGAEAIAFRMVDGGDNERCGVDDDGKAHCSEDSVGRFEIYLPQSLNLPAANPDVKFFYGEYKDSEMHISSRKGQTGVEEKASRLIRYRKGEYKLAEGRTNHFAHPYAYPDPGHLFALIYAHEGKGRWPVAPLREVGFRGDWIQGMDMVIL